MGKNAMKVSGWFGLERIDGRGRYGRKGTARPGEPFGNQYGWEGTVRKGRQHFGKHKAMNKRRKNV